MLVAALCTASQSLFHYTRATIKFAGCCFPLCPALNPLCLASARSLLSLAARHRARERERERILLDWLLQQPLQFFYVLAECLRLASISHTGAAAVACARYMQARSAHPRQFACTCSKTRMRDSHSQTVKCGVNQKTWNFVLQLIYATFKSTQEVLTATLENSKCVFLRNGDWAKSVLWRKEGNDIFK